MPATKTAPKNRIAANGHPAKPSLYSLDKLTVEVVGITPLLCANPADMQPEGTGPSRGSKKDKDNSPEAVARRAAYFDADGNCAFPNVALYSAIIDAATLMKLKVGSGRYAPSAASILEAGLDFNYKVINTTVCHPDTWKPLAEKDYEIDMRRAVNQNTGGAIVAIRPRFDKWAAKSNSDCMGVIDAHFDDILRFAGMSVGLGAFRAYIKPKGRAKKSAGGPFGKFAGEIAR
jgi:hypothetical protein